MQRPLTFPKTLHKTRWVNRETGIEIIRRSGAHGGRPEYRVLVPVNDRELPTYQSMPRRSLIEAKSLAGDFARNMRAQIELDYWEASIEESTRQREQASAGLLDREH